MRCRADESFVVDLENSIVPRLVSPITRHKEHFTKITPFLLLYGTTNVPKGHICSDTTELSRADPASHDFFSIISDTF